MTSTLLTGGDSTENPTVHHWQRREIIVDTEKPQNVAVDDEFITNLPVRASDVRRTQNRRTKREMMEPAK